jgi:inosine-uridine nucleoside N-ribohydrolase
MNKYLIFGLLLFIPFSCVKASSPAVDTLNPQSKPVRIILDTDIGPDFDDVGAFAVLHALADKGEAKILATVASNRYPQIAEVIDVLNTYFNRPDIPIGVPKGPSVELTASQGWVKEIVANYPHKITSNKQVPDPVEVYRKVLSRQPDHSITIASTGFFTNLANLLESGSDQYSELTGRELVRKKVKKLVSMGGKFPSGAEFNVYNDIPSANYVFKNWPPPIIFLGFKVGLQIKTGLPLIHNSKIRNDPVKDVFKTEIPKIPADTNGHPSWDETTVLTAVRGTSPYFKKISGHINTVNAERKVSWDSTRSGQYYLVLVKPASCIEKVLNTLMQHQPGN